MPIVIPLNTKKRKVTLDGTLAVLSFGFVVAYLIAPQFVAGLVWNLGLSFEAWWN